MTPSDRSQYSPAPPARWLTALALAGATTLVLFQALPVSVQGQATDAKLTTRLAELADLVPQDDGRGQPSPASMRPLAYSALPKALQDTTRGRRLRIDDRNTVQVYVLMREVTDDAVRRLMAAGAAVEIADAPSGRVQARVPASRLRLLASLPDVTFIRLPTYAVRSAGSVQSEGDAILNADVARQQFGVDGRGVKVGVISDGLKGLFATNCVSCPGVANGPIARGDLPAATGTRAPLTGVLIASSGGIVGQSFQSDRDLEGLPPANPPCGFSGAGAEGTALLEIVHDLAPGAQLAFANADTDLAFNQAVNALAAANDVVVDDLGFFAEAYDGTSRVSSNTAAALNNPANRIRTYITSVGNGADNHYFGGFVNSGVDGTTVTGLTTPGRLHLFQRTAETTDVLNLGDQPFNVISLPSGGEVVVFLSWNDPAGRSTSNYDLYLVRESNNTVVAKSTDVQNGGQDPVEFVDFTNDGASGLFRIVIQNVRDQAPARALNLFSFQPQCAQDGPRLIVTGRHERQNFNTATRSVSAQSDSGGSPVSVISVGAICSGSVRASSVFPSSTPNESCNDRTRSTIEFFSSRGPTLDGRQKPDITAIDGVEITGAGSFPSPFFGTSAAAPHVAGQAALLLQAAPCLVSGAPGANDTVPARQRLRNLIISTATPLSAEPDNTFGAGLANVLASVGRTLPARAPGAGAAVFVSGNTPGGAAVTATALGFSDPHDCQLTQLQWTGGCGTPPGSSLSCPFGTTNVSVAASNNGVTFSPPAQVAVTVTNFAVTPAPASATVTAGQSATYRVTISAQGGTFGGNVALSCSGLPPGTSCSFNPATVSPGATSVESTLTITTTGRGAAGVGAAGAIGGVATIGVAVLVAAVGLFAVTRRRPRVRRVFGWPDCAQADGDSLKNAAQGGDRAVGWGPTGSTRARVALERRLSGLRRRRACRERDGIAIRRAWPQALVSFSLTALLLISMSCRDGSQNGAALTLSPASLTFASQITQTTSAAQTVTVRNTGNVAVAIASIAASGDFAQTNTCGASLAVNATCTISVTFTPSANGARTGAVTITDDGVGSPRTVALSGTGIPPPGGTPAGTHTVSIRGTSGTLVNAASATLVVQ
jgi:hypothetical protein